VLPLQLLALRVALTNAHEAGADAIDDKTFAVLAVETRPGPATLQAKAIRNVLDQLRVPQLQPSVMVARLLASPGAVPACPSVEQPNALYQKADAELLEGEYAKAVLILDKIIAQLEEDCALDADKRQLLRTSRVEAARALIAAGGNPETGRGETAQGRRAHHHLRSVLRVEPLFALPPAQFPPRVRLALDYARQQLAPEKRARLQVSSELGDMDVFVEGHKVGTTPLTLESYLPPGTYRLWGERLGRRTLQQRVDADDGSIVVTFSHAAELDLTSDATLRWHVRELTDDAMARLAKELRVNHVLMVTHHAATHSLIHYNSGDGLASRAAAVTADVPNAAEALARFAVSGEVSDKLRPFRMPTIGPTGLWYWLPITGRLDDTTRRTLDTWLMRAFEPLPSLQAAGPDDWFIWEELWLRHRKCGKEPDIKSKHLPQAFDHRGRLADVADCLAQPERLALWAAERELPRSVVITEAIETRDGRRRMNLRILGANPDGSVDQDTQLHDLPARTATDVAGGISHLLRLAENHVGSLDIRSGVDHVRVSVDGVEVGVTPITVPVTDLRLGRHVLKASAEGYQSLQTVFHVAESTLPVITLFGNGTQLAAEIGTRPPGS
jgi:hypothetical protein